MESINKHLEKAQFTDPDAALSPGWETRAGAAQADRIKADRLLDGRIKGAVTDLIQSADLKPRQSEADFKRALSERLSKLDSKNSSGKVLPLRWRANEALLVAREAVLGEGVGIYRWASAAILAFAIGLPLMIRTSGSETAEQEEGLSVSHSASMHSEGAKPLTQGRDAGPGTLASEAPKFARSESPWRAVPPGDVKPTLRSDQAKQDVSAPASDFELREKELLANLEKSANKSEKVAALRALEAFYKANGAQDRMRATQLRIEEVVRNK